jgi:hypothetical protein
MSALFVPVATTAVIAGDAGTVGARKGTDACEGADMPTALLATRVKM